jgi:hypothetical protein
MDRFDPKTYQQTSLTKELSMDITLIAWVFLVAAIGYGLFYCKKKQSGLVAEQKTSDEEE